MAIRTCTVSFTGPSGLTHSVEVTAASVYEAVALGVSLLRKDGWVDNAAPGTTLTVEVREPVITHRVTVAQIHRWCEGVAVSPDEVIKRRRVKELLGTEGSR